MATDDGKGGARPAPSGASVAFICGTSAWADGFLSQGKKWAKAIQSAAGGATGVQVGDMGKDAGPVATTLQTFSRASAQANVPTATLDQTLGGLRGHTLVFVTHGLETHDPNLSQKQKEDTQGLLVFNAVPGESPKDRVLFKMHLDFMQVDPAATVPEDASVIPTPALASILDDDDGKKFKKDVRDFAPIVSAIRLSVYSQIYFAACGGGRRLELFAKRLKELTQKSIFWNDDTISFPTPPDAPFAEVGAIVNGQVPQVRDGTPFFKSDGTNLVKLQTGTKDFFKGSMRRLP
jgi:hypothetical protein